VRTRTSWTLCRRHGELCSACRQRRVCPPPSGRTRGARGLSSPFPVWVQSGRAIRTQVAARTSPMLPNWPRRFSSAHRCSDEGEPCLAPAPGAGPAWQSIFFSHKVVMAASEQPYLRCRRGNVGPQCAADLFGARPAGVAAPTAGPETTARPQGCRERGVERPSGSLRTHAPLKTVPKASVGRNAPPQSQPQPPRRVHFATTPRHGGAAAPVARTRRGAGLVRAARSLMGSEQPQQKEHRKEGSDGASAQPTTANSADMELSPLRRRIKVRVGAQRWRVLCH